MLDIIKSFLREKYGIVLLSGVGLLLIAVVNFSYSKTIDIPLRDKPNMYIFVPAIILIGYYLVGKIIFSMFNDNKERRKYSYIINIDASHKICIKQDDISSYIGDKNKVVLLPANTSFDEKCITDTSSALGSYFLKNFPSEIERAKSTIIETATRAFSLSRERRCSDVGDTILLSEYDGSRTNILISAVTQDCPGIGIQADATGIILAIKNALTICSEKRYDSITMPIIGTGHGGIPHRISLLLICLQYYISINYLQNHHVKEMNIIIFDPEKRLKTGIDETVGAIKKFFQ